MVKTRSKVIEKRKYTRLQIPVDIIYTLSDSDKIYNAVTKNISADGLRFETHNKELRPSEEVELKLKIPNAVNAVHAKGRVIWKRKLSLEDAAPFDVGIEFTEVEEDNKNTFLKFLCDLIYELSEETKDVKKRKT